MTLTLAVGMTFDFTHKGEWCYRAGGNAHLVEFASNYRCLTRCGRELLMENAGGKLTISRRLPWGVDVCVLCAEGMSDAGPQVPTSRSRSRRRHR